MVVPSLDGGRRRPPVVMLGGGGSTLSVTRSLARAGVEVHVLGEASSPVRFSRHCAFTEVADGDDLQERWLAWLQTGPRGAVILTCHDDGLELVARHRPALLELGYRPLEANDEVLLAMLDKQQTYELAARVGVPAPRTWRLDQPEDLERAAAEAPYPCAVKPRHSHEFARALGGKLVVVGDEGELRAVVGRIRDAGLGMIVTELVPGRDDQHFSYYTLLDEHGEPLFHLTKRKLRQFPTGSGPGTYHVTDWNPEVAELGLRYIREIGLRGIANPEFKRDARDGVLKLIEVNHRFTAINELLQTAGIDLSLLAYSRLARLEPPPLNGYRRGASIWFPTYDLRAFLAYRRAGELRFGDWARSLARRQRPVLFAADDPLPSVVNLPLRAGARVRARAQRRAAPGDP